MSDDLIVNCLEISFQVNGGSLAEKAGLRVGDALIRVNNTDIFQLRHKDAQDTVARAGNNFELVVSRSLYSLVVVVISKLSALIKRTQPAILARLRSHSIRRGVFRTVFLRGQSGSRCYDREISIDGRTRRGVVVVASILLYFFLLFSDEKIFVLILESERTGSSVGALSFLHRPPPFSPCVCCPVSATGNLFLGLLC